MWFIDFLYSAISRRIALRLFFFTFAIFGMLTGPLALHNASAFVKPPTKLRIVRLRADSRKGLLNAFEKYGFNKIASRKIAKSLVSALKGEWYDQTAKVLVEYDILQKRKTIFRVEFCGAGRLIKLKCALKSDTVAVAKSGAIMVMKGVINENLGRTLDRITDLPAVLKKTILNLYKESLIRADANSNFKIVYDKSFNVLAMQFIEKNKKLSIFVFDSKSARQKLFFSNGSSVIAKKIDLILPVRGGYVSSRFGPRQDIFGANRTEFHYGTDYCVPLNSAIYATHDGEVVYTDKRRKYGYGVNLIIRHDNNGFATRYGHLNSFASGVRVGSKVRRGQLIGFVGSTGYATGPHVHFELLISNGHSEVRYWKKVDSEKNNTHRPMQLNKTEQPAFVKMLARIVPHLK
jgi:murein DD-endopeptidase MepM/ murein hydrolase activator NlpD